MITLSSTGGRTLVQPRPVRKRKLHRDGWLAHAVFGYGPEFMPAVSGKYYMIWQFQLVPGTYFYYVYDSDWGRAFLPSQYAFPLNFTGEAYNLVMRPNLLLKGSYADVSAFLAAH